jgi:Rrf2 family transcriptional regulator, iron-sulfur cluster assembly transcription factor
MQLSQAAELAVRGIRVLALKGGDQPTPMDLICAEADLPKQYLVKIFAMLARVGLVRPVRGKHGGYLLGRPAEDISLLEVIEAVEGPIALNFCQAQPPQCDNEDCGIRTVWCELQQLFKDKLSNVNMAQASACGGDSCGGGSDD